MGSPAERTRRGPEQNTVDTPGGGTSKGLCGERDPPRQAAGAGSLFMTSERQTHGAGEHGVAACSGAGRGVTDQGPPRRDTGGMEFPPGQTDWIQTRVKLVAVHTPSDVHCTVWEL